MKLRKLLAGVTLAGSLYTLLCGCSIVEFSTSTIPNVFPFIAVGTGLAVTSITLDKPSRLLKHVAAITICSRTMLYKLGHKSRTNRRCYKLAKQLGSYRDLYEYVVFKYEESETSEESTIFYM